MAIMANMYARYHKLWVEARQLSCFLQYVRRIPRHRRATCDSGRAKRALPVTAILDLEPGTCSTGISIERLGPVVHARPKTEGHEFGSNEGRIVARHNSINFIHSLILVLSEGSRAACCNDSDSGVSLAETTHEVARVGIGLISHRAGIDHRDIGIRRIRHRLGAAPFQLLPHTLCVVLICLAPEGVVPNGRAVLHGSVRAFFSGMGAETPKRFRGKQYRCPTAKPLRVKSCAVHRTAGPTSITEAAGLRYVAAYLLGKWRLALSRVGFTVKETMEDLSMLRRKRKLLGALAVAAIALPLVGCGEDPIAPEATFDNPATIRVRNNLGGAVLFFYNRGCGTTDWSADMLSNDPVDGTIQPGDSKDFKVEAGCYDFWVRHLETVDPGPLVDKQIFNAAVSPVNVFIWNLDDIGDGTG